MWTSKTRVDWRTCLGFAVVMVWGIGGLVCTAEASIGFPLSAGTREDHGLASTSPGTPIELDFRTLFDGRPTLAQPPIFAFNLSLYYSFGQQRPSAVKLQLATGEIFSLPFPVLGDTHGVFTWYTTKPNPNPDYPVEPTPREQMPPALRAEMKDGVLSARLWAEGLSNSLPTRYEVFTSGNGFRLDMTDLGYLASHYGTTSGAFFPADLDGDEDVDLSDLGNLASYYHAGEAQAYADFEALVPEPGSLLILLPACLAIRRQRQR
jgi:hypothetical protein